MTDDGSGLGRRIALGGLVLVLLRLSLKLIGLISIAILFRILTPEDFGIVALAMLVVGFVEVFSEFGFEQSLLRDANAKPSDYDLVWTLNALRGAGVATALALSAPLAAAFLKEPRLEPVILCLALAPLIDGLQNVGVVDFAKQLKFHREYRLKVSQKLLSFVVTIIAALVLRNYWALVVGTLAGRGIGLMLSYTMHPFRPSPRLAGWRGVMSFSSWILLNNVLLFAGNQTDKIVIQRAFDAQTVGIVRIAEEVSGMVMEFVWPIERALYAGYVAVAHQAERFHATLINGIGLVSALGVPLALGLGVMAEPAILLLLGEKGRPAVPFVQVYVLHGALRSCLCGIFPVFLVLKRPEINAQVTFALVTVRLAVLAVAFPYLGLMAVPWSMVAGSVATFVLAWWRMTTLTHLPSIALPRAIWRSVVGGLGLALAGNVTTAAIGQELSPLVEILILAPVCAASYVAIVLSLWFCVGRPDGPERIALIWLHSRVTGQFRRSRV